MAIEEWCMSAIGTDRPQYASPTRVDVTDCQADQIPNRVQKNRVHGSEVHLERRGGRTYLVTTPTK